MKTMKRIHKVVIKRMVDESPDTSWLGEYSDRATSEFSIDRQHSLDCASQTYNVTVEGIRTLKHAVSYLLDTYLHGQWPSDSVYVDDCQAAVAVDLLGETLDAIGECDCGESGSMRRGEVRYFNPSFNYVDADGKPKPGNTPEDVREYVRQDYERMESLNRGDWCFLGVRAEAEVSLTGDLLQEVSSGGLWGYESDAGNHFAEVEQEQLGELRSQLHAMGFSQRAISAAFKTVEHKEL